MQTPKIIAEIGCNHKGDMNIAKEMIQTAALYCKADVVKFQKRCNRELLTPEEYNAPHPHPENSYGTTYSSNVLTVTLQSASPNTPNAGDNPTPNVPSRSVNK